MHREKPVSLLQALALHGHHVRMELELAGLVAGAALVGVAVGVDGDGDADGGHGGDPVGRLLLAHAHSVHVLLLKQKYKHVEFSERTELTGRLKHFSAEHCHCVLKTWNVTTPVISQIIIV